MATKDQKLKYINTLNEMLSMLDDLFVEKREEIKNLTSGVRSAPGSKLDSAMSDLDKIDILKSELEDIETLQELVERLYDSLELTSRSEWAGV